MKTLSDITFRTRKAAMLWRYEFFCKHIRDSPHEYCLMIRRNPLDCNFGKAKTTFTLEIPEPLQAAAHVFFNGKSIINQ